MRDMVQVRRSGGRNYDAPQIQFGRSQFNMSHGVKMTFDASYLYPILVKEVLPGDTWTCRLNGFTRIFSPLDAPVMDNIELETLFFYVPNRLLWNHWEDFNGAHEHAGAQDTTYTIPVLDTGLTVDHDQGTAAAQLAAYMGLPHGLANPTNINALPFRAYNLIYNEWFRDQNLISEITVDVDDGPDTVTNYALRKSAKKHDYFTSSLPYLQKGTASYVDLGTAYLRHNVATGGDLAAYSDALSDYYKLDIDEPDGFLAPSGTLGNFANALNVNLSTALSVNAMRQAVAIQQLLERDARGGTRYVEHLKSHWGVTSPDFRLQRPEYLGGGKNWITVSPVANTSDTANADQGELRGVGTGTIAGHGWAKSFVEHGYIIGIMRARGDITYFQGTDKMWTRSSRYDFYIPALANLGEQSVLVRELYGTSTSVFGYQERWAEYRQSYSRIAGKMNPDVSGSLSMWHLAEDFSGSPSLNQTFVEDQTPMGRITTVDTEPDFIADLWFDMKAARIMPIYSIPSLTNTRF